LENINLFLKKKKREKYKIKLIQSNGDYYRILGFSQDILNRKKPFGGGGIQYDRRRHPIPGYQKMMSLLHGPHTLKHVTGTHISTS